MHAPRGIKVLRLKCLSKSRLIQSLESSEKTLLLLGDGIFIDAYSLKKSFSKLYIQRILNMYQFQKTIDDYFYDEIGIIAILRLSEIDQWDRDILWNIREALEKRFLVTGVKSELWIIEDQNYSKPYITEYFRTIEGGDREWEEIPQAAEWR
ncbi:MAG: hypothetical protein RXN92_01395 [Thermoplasmatales archaeon]